MPMYTSIPVSGLATAITRVVDISKQIDKRVDAIRAKTSVSDADIARAYEDHGDGRVHQRGFNPFDHFVRLTGRQEPAGARAAGLEEVERDAGPEPGDAPDAGPGLRALAARAPSRCGPSRRRSWSVSPPSSPRLQVPVCRAKGSSPAFFLLPEIARPALSGGPRCRARPAVARSSVCAPRRSGWREAHCERARSPLISAASSRLR